jgi:hypothetical protein
MYSVFRFSVVLVSALLTVACATVHEPRLRFGKRQTDAAILSGTPQVFARESLINDRRREVELIEGMLAKATPDQIEFGPDLSRQVETIVALSARLGLGFDAGVARDATRADALADKRHEIELRKLELELAQLDAQAATLAAEADSTAVGYAKTGEDAGEGEGEEGEEEGGGEDPGAGETLPVAETPPGIARPDTGAIAEDLTASIDRLRKSLRELDALGEVPRRGNPRDEFRDLRAYRDELRAARNEALLDDGHDDGGLALYRLRMPATVLPGSDSDRLGVLRYRIDGYGKSDDPAKENEEKLELYRAWLGHLTHRLNTIASDARPDQLGDRSLEFLGSASDLFTPVSFYLSKERDKAVGEQALADPLFDYCFNFGNAGLAWQKGCVRLVVALPPGMVRQAEQIFPRMEHVRAWFWVDVDKDHVANPPEESFTHAVEALVARHDCDNMGRELWYRALLSAVTQLAKDSHANFDLQEACYTTKAGAAINGQSLKVIHV